MCGIFGCTGHRDVRNIVKEGTKRNSYRGYDSFGFVGHDGQDLIIQKVGGPEYDGRIDATIKELFEPIPPSHLMLGHTRWSTNGRPSKRNAHPQTNADGSLAIIHNGIIENSDELRDKLRRRGYIFSSETDTEVLAHLIEDNMRVAGIYNGPHYSDDVFKIQKIIIDTLKEIIGYNALLLVSRFFPDTIFAGRTEGTSTIYISQSDGMSLVSSDESSLAKYSNSFYPLDDYSSAVIQPRKLFVIDKDHKHINPIFIEIDPTRIDSEERDIGDALRFEIFEQPEVLARKLDDTVLGEISEIIRNANLVYLLGMGTAQHAAQVGEQIIEEFYGIPAKALYSTEFVSRYENANNNLINEKKAVIVISQSGTTAESFEALQLAKKKNAKVASIVNVMASEIARKSDVALGVKAGREIAVVSTKAYTAQLKALAQIGLLGPLISEERKNSLQQGIDRLHYSASETLRTTNEPILELANTILTRKYKDLYILGTGINFPTAQEGALKIKESAYLHGDGIEAFQEKHGPLTIIHYTPSIFLLTDERHGRILDAMSEVKSKGGIVYCITDGSVDYPSEYYSDENIIVPKTDKISSPIIYTLPLQLLAFHLGSLQGIPVSTPHYIAKSATTF